MYLFITVRLISTLFCSNKNYSSAFLPLIFPINTFVRCSCVVYIVRKRIFVHCVHYSQTVSASYLVPLMRVSNNLMRTNTFVHSYVLFLYSPLCLKHTHTHTQSFTHTHKHTRLISMHHCFRIRNCT